MKKIFSLLLLLVVLTACVKEEKTITTLIMYSGSSSSNYEYTYDYEKNTLIYDSFDTGDTDSIMLDDIDLDQKLNDKINNYTLVDKLEDKCEGRDGCSTSYILIEYEDGSKKYVSADDSTKAIQEIELIFSELFENENTAVATVYELEYYDDGIPGNTYNIYFLSDKSIKVVHKPGCSTAECINGEVTPSENTYIVSFSEEGMEVIWNWAHQVLQGNSKNELISSDLNMSDQKILWSIIYNNESYLWYE